MDSATKALRDMPTDALLGIISARPGCQPMENLDAFLRSLPNFGRNAAGLVDAINGVARGTPGRGGFGGMTSPDQHHSKRTQSNDRAHFERVRTYGLAL